jgi:hypothetical protein
MKGGEPMATYRYIRAAGIRALIKENNKRCGADFLNEFDKFIYDKVLNAVKLFNGHRKTLDSTVAKVALGDIKTKK